MDDRKFLCGQCNNGYKNKSSLRRHINSIHNEKRSICGTCNKAYFRNVDYIKHITKFHQPLICKQGPENVEVISATAHAQKPTNSNSHNIRHITDIMNGNLDWEKIIRNDLALSDDEETTPVKISIGTSTDLSKNPSANTEMNTSPLAIVDLEQPTYITTHGLPNEAKTDFKIIPKPSTQIGCVPSVLCKTKEIQTDPTNHPNKTTSQIQTDNPPCKQCYYEEHQILKRQSYIIQDAILNTQAGYTPPTTSREDRSRMPLPGTTKHEKWVHKLAPQLKPRSPQDFPRYKSPAQFTKPELLITSTPQPTSSRVKKPTALTIDNEVYTAICSRKRTQPTLVTSPKHIFSPPPPSNGAWSYRTSKF